MENIVMSDSLTYCVTPTKSGKWLHSCNANFLFAFISNKLSDREKAQLTETFEATLTLLPAIKNAVVDTVGKDALVDNLYFIDKNAMTKAMNSIPGMGMTSVDQSSKKADGTLISINLAFFSDILANLGGEVEPMQNYLFNEMKAVQSDAKRYGQAEYNGIVIGVISQMPIIGTQIISFQYIFVASKTKETFGTITCIKTDIYQFDYDYTRVSYNYNSPAN
jgi:hypothetical protein